jgi:PAS domain S-box-containing protein
MDLPQRALLEMLPSPVFFLDSDALIQDFNSAFVRAMGQSAAGMVGKNFYDFIPKEHQEELYQGMLKAIAGENNEMRCPIITRTGTRIFLIQAEPYKGHNSGEAHIIALAKDITDEVASEEAQKNKYQSLHSATLQTVEAIANVVELRDPYLRGHHNRVGEMAKSIAQQLNLPEEEVTGIEMAARVHDIGSLYVPFEILIKPGEISEAESEIIHQHCQAGFDILCKIDFPWPIAEMVLQHHECFDGSGYPQGLRGDKISIGARIIAVADSFDAMISDRPFRAAVSRNEALQRLTTTSGKQYDGAVVSALFKTVHPA